MKRHFTDLPPLALYIHLPWCVAKCPYCDFNSHAQPQDSLPESDYIDAVLADLASEMPGVWGRTISSVFIGGGTPSLFSADAIDTLLSGVRALTALNPDIEITMEANPGTFEQEKFNDFFKAGINRLSIGIQSFNEMHLQRLGRIHGSAESLAAADIARQAGFDNINLDLMFGLPEQSIEEALDDVRQALTIKPEHLSYYQLTLEPNTLFHKYPPILPEDDLLWEVQSEARKLFENAGYGQYEVSAWSQAGRQCLHNTNYWLFGDYLGIGAGAHGKITSANDATIRRRAKQRHPVRYMQTAQSGQHIGEEHEIAIMDTAMEFMMNALRLVEGFRIQDFQIATGLPLRHWQHIIDKAESDSLLYQDIEHIRPTAHGFNFLNDLLERFMVEDENVGDKTSGSGTDDLVLRYPTISIKSEPPA